MRHLVAPERRGRVWRRAAVQPGRQAGDALDADTLDRVFARLNAFLSGERRPPMIAGVIVAAALVAACTAMIYPLKLVTAVSSLGVVYLFGVVVVSAFWGVWLGVATSLVSAAAFNFFHLPPVGQFTIADSRNWVALAAFFVAALATSWVSELARHRAGEAERRRAEADLTAEIARLVLPRAAVGDALGLIGRRLAAVFELPWATITLEEARGDGRRVAIPLAAGERRLGTLVIPAGMPDGRRHAIVRAGGAPAQRRAGARARAGGADGRGGPDRGPASQRGGQDSRPARGLARSSLTGDRDGRRRCRSQSTHIERGRARRAREARGPGRNPAWEG